MNDMTARPTGRAGPARLVVLLIVLCLTALTVGAGSTASADTTTSADYYGISAQQDTEVRAILARIGDGTWTNADLTYLKQFPDIARQVSDPTAAGVIEQSETIPPTNATTDNTEQCGWWYRAWFDMWNVTHTEVIYQWHHGVTYCLIWNQQITRFTSRSDWISNYDSFVVNFQELTGNNSWGLHTMRAYSYRARHIARCVFKYGCYQNFYPHATIWVGAVGRAGYSGGAR